MTRLPIPGSDNGTWGNILNNFLDVAHNTDGSLKSSSLTAAGAEVSSNKGQPGGYAALDSTGKVPTTQLPTLTATSTSSTTTSTVTSVAGRTGAVTLKESDIANLSSDLAAKATDSAVVHLSGNETIAGVKTFSSSPVIPTAALPESAIANLISDLAAKAPISNPTFTGTVTLAADPTTNLQAATKHYVDATVSAGAPDATTTTLGLVQLAGDLSGTATAPTVPGLATKAVDSTVVHNTGAETIAGVKTFSSALIIPTAALPESAIANLTTDLAATEKSANKDQANGYAGLDSSGLLKTSELPGSVVTANASAIAWQASTAYRQGQLVTYQGQTYVAQTSFTSGVSFNPASWTALVSDNVQIVSGGNLSASYSLPLALPETWLVGTLTANTTITISGQSAGSKVKLLLTENGTGGHTLTVDMGASSQSVGIVTSPNSVSEVDMVSPDGANLYIEGPAASLLTPTIVTTSGSVIVPAGAGHAHIIGIAGGGGGGGGGSAALTGGVTTQVGGSGGGSAVPQEGLFYVTPGQTITATIGAGQSGGAGGAASSGSTGNAGSTPGIAGETIVSGAITMVCPVPGSGVGGGANSTSEVLGGAAMRTIGSTTLNTQPGYGGQAVSSNGTFGAPGAGFQAFGGDSGFPASSTQGGLGGANANGGTVSSNAGNHYAATTSGSNGADGQSPGQGGAGGGGGAPGGAGGNGGNGAPGAVFIEWLA